jgi:hypothetical protein
VPTGKCKNLAWTLPGVEHHTFKEG